MQPAAPASDTPVPAAGGRLRFIDMARSIAILMMLEGHFVSYVLSEEAHQPGWWVYDAWLYVRGLTAPIFFTVTGLVFSYLLCKPDAEERFFKIPRVRKGLVRVAELVFWGYIIQIDIRRLPAYLTGDIGGWAVAFHVLQCIGAGLLLMITLFGLRRITRIGATWMWFLAASVVVYFAGVWFASRPDPGFPTSAPEIVRNLFKGPYSVFPLAPWLAFTLYGATAGALIRHFEHRRRGPWFPCLFIGIGLVMLTGGWRIDRTLADALNAFLGDEPARMLAWFHIRAGGALILIGLLMGWENAFGIPESRFLIIGRNTFSIYVVHVIILYGGFIGYSVLGGIHHSLSFGQSMFGAIIFMLAFAAYAQCVGPLAAKWREIRAQKSK
jgi:uncharacterized membrane protein